jgi:uncharacterized protein YgiM (DUF1202 family)
MLVGAIVAYGFLSRGKPVQERTVPIIMPAESEDMLAEGPQTDQESNVTSVNAEAAADSASPIATGNFDDGKARVSAYKVPSAALKKTVDKYASSRANQRAGEITVLTDDTPLNVRSGPSVSYEVLMKVEKGSLQSVLLSVPDEKTKSGNWFLLVDDQKKTVKGWVSGEYCDTRNVIFPD